MSRTLIVANIKGGVGKTTTTVNLGAALRERGCQVLVIDLDPQASLTLSAGFDPRRLPATIADALSANTRPLRTLILSRPESFDLVPANRELRRVEQELEKERPRVYALRDALEPIRTYYDYILVDCPANAGILTGNALAAANEVLIPFSPDFLTLEALDWFISIIREVQILANPNLRVAGFVLVMYDSRTRHAREMVAAAQEKYGEIPFFNSAIPLNVRLREAPLARQTILQLAPDSPAAQAYRNLAQEIAEGTQAVARKDLDSAAMGAGDPAKPYSAFCQATDLTPTRLDAWAGRARTAPHADEAIRAWARVLQLDSSHQEAQKQLDALLNERLGTHEIDAAPELMALGHFMLEANQLARAEALYRRVTELAPNYIEAWLGRARTVAAPALAVQCYDQVLQVDSSNAQALLERPAAVIRLRAQTDALIERAAELSSASESAQAHDLFLQAAQVDPQNDRAWVGCARTAQDARAAAEFAQRALQANPDNWEARNLYRWFSSLKQEHRRSNFPPWAKWTLALGLVLVLVVLLLVARGLSF